MEHLQLFLLHLAYQIEEQFIVLGSGFNFKTALIIGGSDLIQNSQKLEEKPHIVIATPGRLAHLISTRTKLSAEHLRFLVLDEADRLFETKVWKDVEKIVKALPKNKKQILLFSATLESLMKELSHLKLKTNAEFIEISTSSFSTVNTITQQYFLMPQVLKLAYLVLLLRSKKWKAQSIIIFVSTCEYCRYVSETLNILEIPCVALHSEINQRRRLAALGKFKDGVIKTLISTDVGSRGLDIPEVELVLNYDVPRISEDYMHRCGRTARANRNGFVLTFVTQHDVKSYLKIEHSLKKKTKII